MTTAEMNGAPLSSYQLLSLIIQLLASIVHNRNICYDEFSAERKAEEEENFE